MTRRLPPVTFLDDPPAQRPSGRRSGRLGAADDEVRRHSARRAVEKVTGAARLMRRPMAAEVRAMRQKIMVVLFGAALGGAIFAVLHRIDPRLAYGEVAISAVVAVGLFAWAARAKGAEQIGR